jgi:hypothetical protein
MGKKNEERTPLLKNNNSSSSATNFGQFYGSSSGKKIEMPIDAPNASMPSIISCLWGLFKWDISGAMLAKFLSDLLQFSSPLLLGFIPPKIPINLPYQSINHFYGGFAHPKLVGLYAGRSIVPFIRIAFLIDECIVRIIGGK